MELETLSALKVDQSTFASSSAGLTNITQPNAQKSQVQHFISEHEENNDEELRDRDLDYYAQRDKLRFSCVDGPMKISQGPFPRDPMQSNRPVLQKCNMRY